MNNNNAKSAKKKHLSGMTEYRECCYSCKYCRIKKNGFICVYLDQYYLDRGDKCYIHRCVNWTDGKLVQCDICNKFVRSLGNHVRVHGMTSAEYKKEFGYNRGTSLACDATKQALFIHAKETNTSSKLIEYQKEHEYVSRNLGNHYTIRFEGRMNIKESKLHMSEETKLKISNSNKGKHAKAHGPMTEEHKKKLSTAHKHRLKNDVKRTIVQDEQGKIVSYNDEFRGYMVPMMYRGIKHKK